MPNSASVCSPSVSTIITCRAPSRTTDASSVVSPALRPSSISVLPRDIRLSIATPISVRFAVSGVSTVAVVENEVMLIRAMLVSFSTNWSTIEYANVVSSGITLVLPETLSMLG